MVGWKSIVQYSDKRISLSRDNALDHELEGWTVLGIRPGEAVVLIGAYVLPLGIRLDLVPAGVLLHLNGDQLIDVVRGDPAVRRNAEDPIFLRRSRCRSDLSAHHRPGRMRV